MTKLTQKGIKGEKKVWQIEPEQNPYECPDSDWKAFKILTNKLNEIIDRLNNNETSK